MNKGDLINEIAAKAGLNKVAAKAAFASTLFNCAFAAISLMRSPLFILVVFKFSTKLEFFFNIL